MEDTRLEATQDGAPAPFAAETEAMAKPTGFPETAEESKETPAEEPQNGGDDVKAPEEEPGEEEPALSERAQKRVRELVRKNKELQKQIEARGAQDLSSLKEEIAALKAQLQQPNDVPEEQKYLDELADHLYGKFRERMTTEEKERAQESQKMDAAIQSEIQDLQDEFEEFSGDTVKRTLEYALKFKTPTLREAYEVVQEIEAAKNAGAQQVLRTEPRKRAASSMSGAAPGSRSSRTLTSEEAKGKSFSDIVDDVKTEMGF